MTAASPRSGHRKPGEIGFLSRIFVQTTLPHRATSRLAYVRRNGTRSLSIVGDPVLGLPYGRYPRLVLSWLSTEAVRTKSRRLTLGPSLTRFLDRLGIGATGGRFGTIAPFRLQLLRLLASSVSYTDVDTVEGRFETAGFRVTETAQLWWDPIDHHQVGSWRSAILLSEPGFRALTAHPVPLDLEVLRALRAPLAIDIYCWLTHRMSYLEAPSAPIPWRQLERQFGSEYRRLRAFRERFRRSLGTVLEHYPAARVTATRQGLLLRPSGTHVPPSGSQLGPPAG